MNWIAAAIATVVIVVASVRFADEERPKPDTGSEMYAYKKAHHCMPHQVWRPEKRVTVSPSGSVSDGWSDYWVFYTCDGGAKLNEGFEVHVK